MSEGSPRLMISSSQLLLIDLSHNYSTALVDRSTHLPACAANAMQHTEGFVLQRALVILVMILIAIWQYASTQSAVGILWGLQALGVIDQQTHALLWHLLVVLCKQNQVSTVGWVYHYVSVSTSVCPSVIEGQQKRLILISRHEMLN